jgi:hypothetical protein
MERSILLLHLILWAKEIPDMPGHRKAKDETSAFLTSM